jgi:hypothetical protein
MNVLNGQNNHVATNEELDTMRTQEVLDKAVTGALILILKWFKVSRKQHGLAVWVSNADSLPYRHIEVRVRHPAAG